MREGVLNEAKNAKADVEKKRQDIEEIKKTILNSTDYQKEQENALKEHTRKKEEMSASYKGFFQKQEDVSRKIADLDKADTEEVTKIDETLSFYQIDDIRFLNGMAGCRAYASTAGFESICEAMYLGKPVLMVPAHIEQDCNAYDAMMAGAGIVSDSFDLELLLRFVGRYTPSRNFVSWVRSCERRIILELERTIASQSEITSIPTFTNYRKNSVRSIRRKNCSKSRSMYRK